MSISPQAVKIMKRRVDSVGANAKVMASTTLEELRKLGHFEFQNWVVDAVNGVERTRRSRDLGIDGYSFFDRHPIQVKQSEHVGREVLDKFETAIERDGKEMGYIVAFSFTKDAYGEAARTREIGKNKVHLVRVSDILELNDIILAALAARTKPDLSHVEPDIARLVAAGGDAASPVLPGPRYRPTSCSPAPRRADRPPFTPRPAQGAYTMND